MSIVRRLLQRVSNVVNPSLYGLCAPSELDQAIRRERSRSDRTGGHFTVVSFFASDGRQDRRVLLPLANHLHRRSRSTDDLGWCREGHLCLILADCTTEQAAHLASEQCRAFSSAELTLTFKLYYYAADASGEQRPWQLGDLPPDTIETEDSHSTDLNSDGPLERYHDSERTTLVNSSTVEHAAPMDVLLMRGMPWWKRSLDIITAATALIVLTPLFATIAIAIRLSSPGPVLFQQFRSGRGGRPFVLYKFRSMTADAELQKRTLLALNEQDGPAFKMEQDPRVTKVGSILRALSFDELPQLWNVLRGDMSLVGPRPLPLDEAKACTDWQRQRTDVTPGLTCFWQVKDRRAKIPFVDWMRMDIRYIGGRSLWTDLRLLAQTILFVIRRKGV